MAGLYRIGRAWLRFGTVAVINLWYILLLGIDVVRHKGRDGDGSNERILVDRNVGGGVTKPRNGSDRYENQNNVKQKKAWPSAQVAVKPYPQHLLLSNCSTDVVTFRSTDD